MSPLKPRAYTSVKAAVIRLYDQVGGVVEVARRLTIGRTLAYAYTDEAEDDRHISFARVVALSGPGCDAAAEYLAGVCDGLFVPLATGTSPVALASAEAARRFGEAMHGVFAALEDGRMDGAEAQRVLPDIDAALQALGQVRARVRAKAEPAP